MKFGVCLPQNFKLENSTAVNKSEKLRALIDGTCYIRQIGYDFIECNVGHIMALCDEDFAEAVALSRGGEIKVEVCNCFIPSEYPLVGDSVDLKAVEKYVAKVMARLSALGVEIVVFGSGRARRVPEDYSREVALGQLKEFLTLAEGLARKAGITVVIEPLNKKECNIFLTVTEVAETVRRLDLPNLKLLADMYHTYAEDESPEVLGDNIDILRHVHIAQPESRLAPTEHPYLEQCGQALREAGYELRVSIESHANDFANDMKGSLPIIKKYF